MDFFGLQQDGITIKDIRETKPPRRWPLWVAVAAVAAGSAWAVWDLISNGYVF